METYITSNNLHLEVNQIYLAYTIMVLQFQQLFLKVMEFLYNTLEKNFAKCTEFKCPPCAYALFQQNNFSFKLTRHFVLCSHLSTQRNFFL